MKVCRLLSGLLAVMAALVAGSALAVADAPSAAEAAEFLAMYNRLYQGL
jgi:hypothetical protein